MPTTVYNVTETAAGFGDGDNESNTGRRTNDPFWFTTPLLFGDDVVKGSSSRDWVLDRFVIDVPEGATVRRITMSKEPQVTDAWFTQLRFCILDPQPAHSHPSLSEDGVNGPNGDANWRVSDPTRNTCFPWSNFEPNTAVYDDVAVERPFPEAVSRQGFGGQSNILTLRGMGTLGGAFTVETASFDLGEIRLRISRTADLGGGFGGTEFDTDGNTSRPGLDLRIEVYNAISVTDRRPSGAAIVSSNTVSWDSLIIGPVGLPDPLGGDWGVFVFPTTPTLALGNTYVYKLVVDGGGVMPAGGPPYIRTALDQGFTGSEDDPISNAGNNNAAGVWWGAGGFGGCAYPPLDGLPNPAEDDEGPLVAGRVFQDDECISPQLAASLAFVGGTRFVWGFDLDGGPGIDHELDGSHPNSTTDIVTLFQDWIDDPAYTEAGTPTAITLDPVEILLNERNSFAAQEDPTDVGTELIIGWVLVPTKATNPDPANLASGISINSPDPDLSWTAGTYPGTAPGFPTHDVYFGTNPSPGAAEFQGNQTGITFVLVGALELNTTYFWRIDEVGPFGTTTGDVWQFTTTALPCDWLDDDTGADFAGSESGAAFSDPTAGAAFSSAGTAEWFDSDAGEAFDSDQVGAKFSDADPGEKHGAAEDGAKFSDADPGEKHSAAEDGAKFSDTDTGNTWTDDQECD